jgi:hypothetical protein
MPGHAVIIRFHYAHESFTPLIRLQNVLEEVVAKAGVGAFDGADVPEIGRIGCLYLYGPDADAILNVVRPILEGVAFMTGAVVRLRYGPPNNGARECEIPLTSRRLDRGSALR